MTRMPIAMEFRPTIIFLLKFLLIYFVANFVYGLWVSSYLPQADSITHWITWQTSWVLDIFGSNTVMYVDTSTPHVILSLDGKGVISVFEGCNGINVMIVFIAFIFAFGPVTKGNWWFVIVGILVIHVANLIRLTLLYFTSLNYPDYFYFIHKYFFTASLYGVTFLLWASWVTSISKRT